MRLSGRAYVPGARRRRLAFALALLAAGLSAMVAHAAHLRREGGAASARARVVELVGTADLSLSSTSRWLRHPSQAEPGAAFSDGPLAFDTDPAGALVGPPRALLGAGPRAEGAR